MRPQDLQDLAQTLENSVTKSGEGLVALSEESPVLLVFLRHAGCTFCREAIADIARLRGKIARSGTRIVLVHMGDSAGVERILKKHRCPEIDRIVDPERRLYRAFGLKRGKLGQVFGPKVMLRGIRALLAGHGFGKPTADALQMPGLFLIHRGSLVRRFRHQSVADRPDYVAICGPG